MQMGESGEENRPNGWGGGGGKIRTFQNINTIDKL